MQQYNYLDMHHARVTPDDKALWHHRQMVEERRQRRRAIWANRWAAVRAAIAEFGKRREDREGCTR